MKKILIFLCVSMMFSGCQTDKVVSAAAQSSDLQCSEAGWKNANLTTFESYPVSRSKECVEFNGCKWRGLFAGVEGRQSKQWVENHNIAAVHSKNYKALKGKTIRIKHKDNQIDAVVLDYCSDEDCNGCCTKNLGPADFLIDLEEFTFNRFGVRSGTTVQWQVCN